MLTELANERTHTVSEWIDWAGGACPVDKRTLVQTQMRFEQTFGCEESQFPVRAGSLCWKHTGEDVLDIIRYRMARS